MTPVHSGSASLCVSDCIKVRNHCGYFYFSILLNKIRKPWDKVLYSCIFFYFTDTIIVILMAFIKHLVCSRNLKSGLYVLDNVFGSNLFWISLQVYFILYLIIQYFWKYCIKGGVELRCDCSSLNQMTCMKLLLISAK